MTTVPGYAQGSVAKAFRLDVPTITSNSQRVPRQAGAVVKQFGPASQTFAPQKMVRVAPVKPPAQGTVAPRPQLNKLLMKKTAMNPAFYVGALMNIDKVGVATYSNNLEKSAFVPLVAPAAKGLVGFGARALGGLMSKRTLAFGAAHGAASSFSRLGKTPTPQAPTQTPGKIALSSYKERYSEELKKRAAIVGGLVGFAARNPIKSMVAMGAGRRVGNTVRTGSPNGRPGTGNLQLS
jgi:hypothetical protein